MSGFPRSIHGIVILVNYLYVLHLNWNIAALQNNLSWYEVVDGVTMSGVTKQVSSHYVSHTESKYNSVTQLCNSSLFIAIQVGSIRLPQLCRAPVAPLDFWLQKLLCYFSAFNYNLTSGTEDQTFSPKLYLCSAKMNHHKLLAYSEALLNVHFFSILPYKQRKRWNLNSYVFFSLEHDLVPAKCRYNSQTSFSVF